jgi:hypothetical protein
MVDANAPLWTIAEVINKLVRLAEAIHRLVPDARIGVVEFRGAGARMRVLPLTSETGKVKSFVQAIKPELNLGREQNLEAAVDAAVSKMKWAPRGKRIILLMPNRPPTRAEFPAVAALIRKFRKDGGIVNTIIVPQSEADRMRLLRASDSVMAETGGGVARELEPKATATPAPQLKNRKPETATPVRGR